MSQKTARKAVPNALVQLAEVLKTLFDHLYNELQADDEVTSERLHRVRPNDSDACTRLAEQAWEECVRVGMNFELYSPLLDSAVKLYRSMADCPVDPRRCYDPSFTAQFDSFRDAKIRAREINKKAIDDWTRGYGDLRTALVRLEKEVTTRQRVSRNQKEEVGGHSNAKKTGKSVPQRPKPIKPKWVKKERALYFGNELIKRYEKDPAESQTTILDAFQKDRWERVIELPDSYKTSKRDMLRSLNKTLGAKSPITFHGAGESLTVQWKSKNTG